jgi:hypothetical protein
MLPAQNAPHNHHDFLLVCPGCDTPRRYLYGWEAAGRFTNSADASRWQCRSCAKLRYASEGGYLRPGRYLRAGGNLPRPEPWFPYVFTSIFDPRLDQIVPGGAGFTAASAPVLRQPKAESGLEWVHSSMGATRKPCARRSEGFAHSSDLFVRSCGSTASNGLARNEPLEVAASHSGLFHTL